MGDPVTHKPVGAVHVAEIIIKLQFEDGSQRRDWLNGHAQPDETGRASRLHFLHSWKDVIAFSLT